MPQNAANCKGRNHYSHYWVVAPEGYDPSTKDYKSSVFPTKLQSHKGQGIRSAYATAALTTRPQLFVHLAHQLKESEALLQPWAA